MQKFQLHANYTLLNVVVQVRSLEISCWLVVTTVTFRRFQSLYLLPQRIKPPNDKKNSARIKSLHLDRPLNVLAQIRRGRCGITFSVFTYLENFHLKSIVWIYELEYREGEVRGSKYCSKEEKIKFVKNPRPVKGSCMAHLLVVERGWTKCPVIAIRPFNYFFGLLLAFGDAHYLCVKM